MCDASLNYFSLNYLILKIVCKLIIETIGIKSWFYQNQQNDCILEM